VNPDIRQLLTEEIVGIRDSSVQLVFMEKYEEMLEEFADHMAAAFTKWSELDQLITKDEQSVIVTAYSYGALNHHLLAMKLLIGGYFVASCNAQRFVLECMATCLLAASDSNVRKKILEGKYSETKSITTLVKRCQSLGLNQDVVKQIEKEIKHYSKLSHPSLLALTSTIFAYNLNPKVTIGVHYDEGKNRAYEYEMKSRVSLAVILPSFIDTASNVYSAT
jgi:hypothetical protein